MKIKINNKYIDHFTGFSVKRNLDSVASEFAFSVRFNPENDDHKESFKPLQYLKCEVYSDTNKLMITGTILNHSFTSDSTFNLLVISGYSKSGILEDVQIPSSMYPLESNNRSLKDIATKLCNAFGINLIVDSSVSNEVNRVFKKTTADVTETVKDYISKLTSQRNILLSHNEKGEVIMYKPKVNGKPKYYFNKDNTIRMTSNWAGQGMYSEINIIRQPSKENAGVSTVDKIKNPLIGVFRTTTKVLSSGDDTDTANAANNELASQLKNIQLKVDLQGLFEDIVPGDLINIHNHEIYSFAYTRWIVSSISLNKDESSETTSLDLVLPETYSGEVPKPLLFYYKSHKRHN
ncbi:hypothetical protein [Flavobacterium phage VK48]|uniref:Baseplate hub protein gp44/GpP-like second domain-containing protein n=8 Tax=Ficleduovirus FCV1 TaxID=2560474 RepID=A0A218M8L8_9CAUD|nr:hypothetical protein [Flavobacterium phage FCV-11]ASD52599.1 hypothetical protein [Flavobacterium phage FCV-16]ASD52673.1 hypothetical protein [Flavobacterium phage FCV-20]ASD53060.1 hypothetical protein [Flavobacterium phage VK20]ASD53134.1 hypothetical protein [Flavobacterium phage VK42]ASD53209.1 hypothetical protein [Flavobacterium phage VK48]ASD53284.1 hypothetical protein [Flavobacterium phage VK52]ASD53358.1 hypothetical protein [Flavobacterium phage VK58]